MTDNPRPMSRKRSLSDYESESDIVTNTQLDHDSVSAPAGPNLIPTFASMQGTWHITEYHRETRNRPAQYDIQYGSNEIVNVSAQDILSYVSPEEVAEFQRNKMVGFKRVRKEQASEEDVELQMQISIDGQFVENPTLSQQTKVAVHQQNSIDDMAADKLALDDKENLHSMLPADSTADQRQEIPQTQANVMMTNYGEDPMDIDNEMELLNRILSMSLHYNDRDIEPYEAYDPLEDVWDRETLHKLEEVPEDLRGFVADAAIARLTFSVLNNPQSEKDISASTAAIEFAQASIELISPGISQADEDEDADDELDIGDEGESDLEETIIGTTLSNSSQTDLENQQDGQVEKVRCKRSHSPSPKGRVSKKQILECHLSHSLSKTSSFEQLADDEGTPSTHRTTSTRRRSVTKSESLGQGMGTSALNSEASDVV